jgi:Zn ribbon nucleic-acid-binding protein
MSRVFKCAKCGNADRRKLKELEDKTQKALYYSMQGTPVFPKKIKCGACGNEWLKSEG